MDRQILLFDSYNHKPIDILELTQAIDKAKESLQRKENDQRLQNLIHNRNQAKNNHVALPLSDKIEFVDITKIIRCQAEGNYTKIFIRDENPLLVS